MSKPKFLYIDDEPGATTEAIRDGLNDTDIIQVTLEQAKVFEDQLSTFETELPNYNGLILDLRLDDNMSTGLKHTAVSLAQELRTKTAAKEKYVDIPIILCSTDKKIEELYDKDQTSHDLFDYTFVKKYPLEPEKVATRLKSIAEGYQLITESDFNLSKILERDVSELDPRVFGRFLDRDNSCPIHELVQHILKELIYQPGPLISEAIVAARLGIDIEKSDDWPNLLKDTFSSIRYTGIFSQGWNRYWADLLVQQFKELTGKRLSSLEAESRIQVLKESSGKRNLVAAEPIQNCVSRNFWTVCNFYKKPLDPLEGFKLFSRKEPRPWQDPKYISFDAAAQRKGRIHPTENERFEEYKKKFPST